MGFIFKLINFFSLWSLIYSDNYDRIFREMKNRGGRRNSYAKTWIQKTTLFFQTWRLVGGQTYTDSVLNDKCIRWISGERRGFIHRYYVQWCVRKWSPSSPKAWFTVFTNLCGVNTPTIAHVKPLIWHHWMGCGEEMCIIGSWEQVQTCYCASLCLCASVGSQEIACVFGVL